MKKYLLLLALSAITTCLTAQTIPAADASKHIGEKVTICSKVYGGRYFEKNEKTLLNLGAAYPDNPLTIVIEGADRKKFEFKPEEKYLNKEVCVTGEIRDFKGKAEIQVTDVSQIVINDEPK